MNQKECLKKLTEFRKLIVKWDSNEFDSDVKNSTRTNINKNINVITKILSYSGCMKLFTISPPPAIGGYIVRNINALDIIFNPSINFDPIKPILDMIDCAIGVIEEDVEFSTDKIKDITVNENLNDNKEEISNKIFIVHGHDNEMKETVARFLKKIDLEPIILHEQSNKGNTIIEKFEENSNVPYAVVLMSPDDVGNSKENKHNLLNRARQNVIFELGYFLGKLGRSNVCVLLKDEVEKPSDYDGIIYIQFDNHHGWNLKLAKELKNSGLKIDMNKI
ncbi:MAG TPA: nucleotide-binding protein [Ignavibacteria bacterium]|nr:nucleotide-binding protein [Ignavibacteria bacterium]HRK00723.1 nucleotide-binding protein [Ignavibacteria bacterium]